MKPDLWDDVGPFEYRHLPESSLSAFFTEERDMLQISKDPDGFWLSNSRDQGASRYDDIEQAKAAGDEEIAAAEAAQDALLLKEAGLPEADWKVSYDDAVRFEQKDGPFWIAADADGMSTRQRWDLYRGDEPLLVGAPRITDVVAEMRRRA